MTDEAACHLLLVLADQGVVVSLKPDGGLTAAPTEKVTPEVLARLKEAKPDLLRVLQSGWTVAAHQRAIERMGTDPPEGDWTVRLQSGLVVTVGKVSALYDPQEWEKAKEGLEAWNASARAAWAKQEASGKAGKKR